MVLIGQRIGTALIHTMRWLSGGFGALGPESRRFESHSGCHVGPCASPSHTHLLCNTIASVLPRCVSAFLNFLKKGDIKDQLYCIVRRFKCLSFYSDAGSISSAGSDSTGNSAPAAAAAADAADAADTGTGSTTCHR